MEQTIQEDKQEANKNMSSSAVFRAMLPSVVVGTLVAIGAQEVCSRYTSNPECITITGMTGQYLAGLGVYFPLHFINNQKRLTKDNGRVDWRKFAQDVGSILISDRFGNKVWAISYALTNEFALRSGLSPAQAGLLSGSVSGTAYSTFTAWAAPIVNNAMNFAKRKIRRTN